MTAPTAVKPALLSKLGYEGDLEKIAKQYQIATVNISKSPYIMIPFVGSNIEMRITVSEITDYPDAGLDIQSLSFYSLIEGLLYSVFIFPILKYS